MNNLGKSLVIIGGSIILLGIAVIVFSRFKVPFLGKLPGDILIHKKNFTFYFPLVTCLLASAILSLIFHIISKIRR
jgi:hypothetical protein